MDLTSGERTQIKQVLQTPQWQTAERLANVLCDKIAYEPKTSDTQWDTIKSVIGKEGEIRGIKRFIQEMYNQSLK